MSWCIVFCNDGKRGNFRSLNLLSGWQDLLSFSTSFFTSEVLQVSYLLLRLLGFSLGLIYCSHALNSRHKPNELRAYIWWEPQFTREILLQKVGLCVNCRVLKCTATVIILAKMAATCGQFSHSSGMGACLYESYSDWQDLLSGSISFLSEILSVSYLLIRVMKFSAGWTNSRFFMEIPINPGMLTPGGGVGRSDNLTWPA